MINLKELREGFGINPDFATFKAATGRFRTRSLFSDIFVEAEVAEQYPPVYSTDQFRRIYIELEDPTGYIASQVLLDSWVHWQRLAKVKWFQTMLEDWNSELEVRLQAKGVISMAKIASTGEAKATAAAKWLAEKGWTPKKRGAPTKDDVAREARKLAEDDLGVTEALERLGLNEAVSG